MAIPDPTDAERHPPAQDAQIEGAVLALALDRHPTALTDAELSLALAGERPAFSALDAVARAVRELVGAGLLLRRGDLIQPTHAAVCFERLQTRP